MVIKRISEIETGDFDIKVIPMNCSESIENVGVFQFEKILVTIKAALRLRRELRAGDREAVVYFPPASPEWIPVCRDILFFLFARWSVNKWLFHFHAGGLPEFLNSSFLGRLAGKLYPRPKVNLSLSKDPSIQPSDFFGGTDLYVPLGLDVPIEFTARSQASTPRLLFVGNLFISKGVEICIRAVASLKSKGRNVVLDLVGGHVDGDREKVLALVDELGVQDSVIFHGVLSGDPKWELFKSADCFVFPSYYPSEKFPNVLIEALGSGLPIVSTQWRGIPELIGENCEGTSLVPIQDQAAFEQALCLILDAPAEEYASYRGSAYKRYEERYKLETFEKKMIEAFQYTYDAD